MLERAQVLQRVNPEACVVHLDGTPGASTVAARLPCTLVTREQTLSSDLMQAADPDHAPTITRAQSLPMLQLTVAMLSPTQQRVPTVPALRHSTPSAERCQALTGFFRFILTLPGAEHTLALRGIYADTSAPGSQQDPPD